MVGHDVPAVMFAAQNWAWLRYAGYEPTGGFVNRPSVNPPCPVSIAVGAGYPASTSGIVFPLSVTDVMSESPAAVSLCRLATVAWCCESPRPVIQKIA